MAGSHALRTRAPLDPKVSFDLHVLGMPPAFVLSQDQTLKFDVRICQGGISLADPLILRSLAYTRSNLVKGCFHVMETCKTRSEEHTSELQSLMRISYAVFCWKKKTNTY